MLIYALANYTRNAKLATADFVLKWIEYESQRNDGGETCSSPPNSLGLC
jgi:hypothetical protein